MDINVKEDLKKIDDLEMDLQLINKPTGVEIVTNGIRHFILICISIITFFPFLWMISSALKQRIKYLIFHQY